MEVYLRFASLLQEAPAEKLEYATIAHVSTKSDHSIEINFCEPMEFGSQDVVLRVSDNHVMIERKGDIYMQQTFQIGLKTEGVYQTEHGSFCMQVETKKLEVSSSVQSGVISIEYDGYLNNTPIGTISVDITYQSKDEDSHEKSIITTYN